MTPLERFAFLALTPLFVPLLLPPSPLPPQKRPLLAPYVIEWSKLVGWWFKRVWFARRGGRNLVMIIIKGLAVCVEGLSPRCHVQEKVHSQWFSRSKTQLTIPPHIVTYTMPVGLDSQESTTPARIRSGTSATLVSAHS